MSCRILSFPRNLLSARDTRRGLAAAFRMWSEVSPFSFREVPRHHPSDLKIGECPPGSCTGPGSCGWVSSSSSRVGCRIWEVGEASCAVRTLGEGLGCPLSLARQKKPYFCLLKEILMSQLTLL